MRFQVKMIDKENKTFEETIVAGNMEEAKKTAQESNPEAKIVSANWVYKQIEKRREKLTIESTQN